MATLFTLPPLLAEDPLNSRPHPYPLPHKSHIFQYHNLDKLLIKRAEVRSGDRRPFAQFAFDVEESSYTSQYDCRFVVEYDLVAEIDKARVLCAHLKEMLNSKALSDLLTRNVHPLLSPRWL